MNVKRFLALVLIVVFSSSPVLSGNVVFAKQTEQTGKKDVEVKNRFIKSACEDVADTIYEIPVGLLAALGVMQGDRINNFNPDREMTRIEFLEAVMLLLGLSDSSDARMETSFKDVKATHPSSWAVKMAEDLGIINGGGEERFYPDEKITTEQAVKILVSAMGYGYYAEAMGGYPAGYMYVAASQKILKSSANEIITRGTAALMLYEAAHRDIIAIVEHSNGDMYIDTRKGNTLLERIFGVYKAVGHVTGTSGTRLTSEDGVGRGKVEIDGMTFLYNKSEVEKLLGLRVEYYYTENKSGDYKLVYVYPARSNSMLVIPADKIINYQNGVYKYTSKDNRMICEVSVPTTANIIYNGQFVIPTTDMMKPFIGEVQLLDSDGDGKYETVFIEDLIYCIVDKVSTRDWILYNKYPLKNGEDAIDLNDVKDSMIILDSTGNAVNFQDITEYDVVTVRMSLGEKRLVSLTVSKEKAEGTVTELSLTDDFISIDGEDYTVSAYFRYLLDRGELSFPELGASAQFLMTPQGEIAGYVPKVASGKRYGYLIKTGGSQYSLSASEKAQLLVLTSLGKVETLKCADKIRVDGSMKEDAESALSMLGGLGNIPRQLIGYETNADGLVISIDTAFQGEGENEYNIRKTFPEEIDGNGPWTYRRASASFNARCNIGDNTVVFWVPNAEDADTSLYYVSGPSAFVTNSSYYVEGYTVRNIDNYADFLVVKSSGVGTYRTSTDIFLVNKIVTASNKDGTVLKKMYGISEGREMSVLIDDRSDLDANGKKVSDTIRSGDIVNIVKSNTGEVILLPGIDINSHTNFQYVLKVDGDDGKPLFKATNRTTYSNSLFMVGGRVVNVKEGYIWVDTNAVPARRAFRLAGFTVYVYNETKERFERGTFGDIDTGDFVVVRLYDGAPRQIVVYK